VYEACKQFDWSAVSPAGSVRIVPSLLLSTLPVGHGVSRPASSALFSVGKHGSCSLLYSHNLRDFTSQLPDIVRDVSSGTSEGAAAVIKVPERSIGRGAMCVENLCMVVSTPSEVESSIMTWFEKASSVGETISYRTLLVQPYITSMGNVPWSIRTVWRSNEASVAYVLRNDVWGKPCDVGMEDTVTLPRFPTDPDSLSALPSDEHRFLTSMTSLPKPCVTVVGVGDVILSVDGIVTVVNPHAVDFDCSSCPCIRTPIAFTAQLAAALHRAKLCKPVTELATDWILSPDGRWNFLQIKGYKPNDAALPRTLTTKDDGGKSEAPSTSRVTARKPLAKSQSASVVRLSTVSDAAAVADSLTHTVLDVEKPKPPRPKRTKSTADLSSVMEERRPPSPPPAPAPVIAFVAPKPLAQAGSSIVSWRSQPVPPPTLRAVSPIVAIATEAVRAGDYRTFDDAIDKVLSSFSERNAKFDEILKQIDAANGVAPAPPAKKTVTLTSETLVRLTAPKVKPQPPPEPEPEPEPMAKPVVSKHALQRLAQPVKKEEPVAEVEKTVQAPVSPGTRVRQQESMLRLAQPKPKPPDKPATAHVIDKPPVLMDPVAIYGKPKRGRRRVKQKPASSTATSGANNHAPGRGVDAEPSVGTDLYLSADLDTSSLQSEDFCLFCGASGVCGCDDSSVD
jgi:hypothetical protein